MRHKPYQHGKKSRNVKRALVTGQPVNMTSKPKGMKRAGNLYNTVCDIKTLIEADRRARKGVANRFVQNFKYYHTQKGLTQQKIADRLGVKRSRVGSWEEGRARPGFDLLIEIANLFGVTIDQLLTEEIK